MTARRAGPAQSQSIARSNIQIGTITTPKRRSQIAPAATSQGLSKCAAFATTPPRNRNAVRMNTRTSATVSGQGYRMPRRSTFTGAL